MLHPNNWQSVLGPFSFQDDILTFLGGTFEPSPTPTLPQPPSSMPLAGIAMCDVFFERGNLEFNVRPDTNVREFEAQAIIFRNPLTGAMLVAGLTYALHRGLGFAIGVFHGDASEKGWEVFASGGAGAKQPGAEYKVRVTRQGSLIGLHVDHVHVVSHQIPMAVGISQCGVYCRAMAPLHIAGYAADQKKKSAFVVMQFSEEFNKLYEDVISPIAKEAQYDVVRADEMYGPGTIIADIEQQIKDADVIIADVSPLNANVFFEVGYARALGKPTVLLAQRGKPLPFDIAGFRVLMYDDTIGGKKRVESGLRQHLAAIAKAREVTPLS